MPAAVQAKLLRALQEGEIEPLGSNQLVRFDVRVVAATSRDLAALVREGKFREDLYYRLNVLPIRVPPLRERRADMPQLVETLCEDIAARSGGSQMELDAAALALLQAQPWRGNIRELRNVLEQVALRTDDSHIGAGELAEVLKLSGLDSLAVAAPEVLPAALALPVDDLLAQPLAAQIAALERRAMAEALKRTGGNRSAAARLLGMSRASFYDKLEAWSDMSEFQTIV